MICNYLDSMGRCHRVFPFPKIRAVPVAGVYQCRNAIFKIYSHIHTFLLGVIGTIILTSIGVSLVSRRIQVKRQLKRNIGHEG